MQRNELEVVKSDYMHAITNFAQMHTKPYTDTIIIVPYEMIKVALKSYI